MLISAASAVRAQAEECCFILNRLFYYFNKNSRALDLLECVSLTVLCCVVLLCTISASFYLILIVCNSKIMIGASTQLAIHIFDERIHYGRFLIPPYFFVFSSLHLFRSLSCWPVKLDQMNANHRIIQMIGVVFMFGYLSKNRHT